MYSTTEFAELVRFASRRLTRYQARHSSTFPESEWDSSEIEAHNHLGAFISRTSFLDRFSEGQMDGISAAEQFEQEIARTSCQVTRFVLLEGFDIPVAEVAIPKTDARLVKLTQEHIEDLRKRRGSEMPADLDRFIGVVALTSHFPADNPPWGPMRYEWTPPRRRAVNAALPWLDYLNLVDHGKLRVLGMFEKCDTLLVDHPVRGVGVEEPTREPRYVYDEDRKVEEWAYDELVRTVEINDVEAVRRHLQRCEQGRQASAQRSDHVNIALRYFRRVAENIRLHRDDYDPDTDVGEDIVIDACTALETMLLDGEKRDKGKILADRVAALVENDAERRKYRKTVERLYRVRSDILHGNERPSQQDLTKLALSAEPVLRMTVAAFLALDGDRESIVEAAHDHLRTKQLRQRLQAARL